MNEWRPMHTAPKDGTRILAYGLDYLGEPRVEIYRWEPDEYAKRPRPYWQHKPTDVLDQRGRQPVAWMPLPEVRS